MSGGKAMRALPLAALAFGLLALPADAGPSRGLRLDAPAPLPRLELVYWRAGGVTAGGGAWNAAIVAEVAQHHRAEVTVGDARPRSGATLDTYLVLQATASRSALEDAVQGVFQPV